MIKSITLYGSSSGRNAGDATLMSSIMDAVDEACGTELLYEIPTIKPGFVRDNYRSRTRAVATLPWNMSVKMLGWPTYRSIMRTDLTLIFDAVLFDRSLYNPLFNFLSTLYLLLPMARRRGKKMAFYNVGAGPVTTPAGRKMLRHVSEMMDFITVRDKASYDILKGIGVKNPRMLVAADAALRGRPSEDTAVSGILESLGLDRDREILALNVNPYLDTWSGANTPRLTKQDFTRTYAAAINRVVEKLDVQVLFVATQHLDVSLSREIMALLKSKRQVALVSNVDHSHYDIKGVLGKVSLLFAMRLHSMILASSGLTPVAGLAYQPKIDHYFEALGLPEYSLSFENFTEDKIVEHILKAWERRGETRKVLTTRIPELQSKAYMAAELVACLHRDEDLDAACAGSGLARK